MNPVKLFCTIIVCIVITGCASTRPENLSKTGRNEEIVLNERISTVSYRGMHVRCEEGALPGVYAATSEDADGVYYFGKERAIWMTNEVIQPKPRLFVGGIYVPKNKANAPRFFHIFEKEIHTTDNIDSFVQQRIVQSAVMPSGGNTNAGVGVNVAGNVIAGALIGALIDNAVGQIDMYPPIEDNDVKRKIYAGIRPADTAQ
ncbi:hypothetical protein HUX88_21420 [Duganella sp. BJB1802]|uniref:hypothetical protein n=1 Tax=unclassified Duganella TaxID=2636909 RepID=UPI0011C18905|nr:MULTISPECIES: hypothetical protein [unclassified Duganella]NVD73089.1 hypothetical protein [Duganella sp. BJB1802]